MDKFVFIVHCVLHGVALLMICYIAIVLYKSKNKSSNKSSNKPRNKVHFYVARDKDETLCLHIGKPFRGITKFCPNIRNAVIVLTHRNFKDLGLNPDDFKNLKWEDKPVEVFLNTKE